jgi:hypothetical protein
VPWFAFENSAGLFQLIDLLTLLSAITFVGGFAFSAVPPARPRWMTCGVICAVAFAAGAGGFVATLLFGVRISTGPVLVVVQAYPQPEFLAYWGLVGMVFLLPMRWAVKRSSAHPGAPSQ